MTATKKFTVGFKVAADSDVFVTVGVKAKSKAKAIEKAQTKVDKVIPSPVELTYCEAGE